MKHAAEPTALARRTWGATVGAIALAPALGMLGACQPVAEQPIRIAAHVWVGYEPMFLARDKGWIDSQQVQLVQTASARDSLLAVAQGQVMGAAVTLDEMLAAREAGMALSLVLVFNSSLGADMLLVRPGIRQLSDLKGKRLGVEASSVGTLMLAQILKLAGLDKRDVQIEFVAATQHADAWQRKKLDALISYEPVATGLLNQGMVRLFDTRQIPNTIVDVLAVRTDLLEPAHTKALQHLISGHFRALDHLMRNPQDAAYRMAAHLNLPASQVLIAYKGLVLPTAANNYRLLMGSPPEIHQSAAKLSALMLDAGLLKLPDQLADLIRAEFLPTDNLLK